MKAGATSSLRWRAEFSAQPHCGPSPDLHASARLSLSEHDQPDRDRDSESRSVTVPQRVRVNSTCKR
eukprot:3568862-Rhodomonas_salina.1